MPRPAPAALRRASSAVASSAAAPCTCRPPPRPAAAPTAPPSSPSSSAPYSTAATTSTATLSGAAVPPVLDFLAPGFGFFSRALPPVLSSSAPPPSRAPTAAPGTSRAESHRPAPPHHRHSFARPAAAAALASAARVRRALVAPTVDLGLGGDGHARRTFAQERDPAARRGKGKEVEREPRQARGSSEGRSGSGGLAGKEDPTTTTSPSPPVTPSSRLRSLLAQHAPPTLPHVRGTGIIRARPSSRTRRKSTSPRTPPSSPHTLTVAQARAALDALTAAAQDGDFYHALSTREQLDLVRALSTVARAVQPFPSPDPLAPRSAPADARRTALRHRASGAMLDLLRRSRHSLTAFASLGTSPYSSLRQSAALLLLDAFTLADALGAVGHALLGDGDGDGTVEARELAEALETLFRPPPFDAVAGGAAVADGEASSGERRNRARDVAMRLENQRTAFALLLQLWRTPASLSSYAAEQALRLVTSYAVPPLDALFDAHVDGSSSSTRAQDGLNDVLRRSYGSLLAALEPSPASWFVDRMVVEGEPLAVQAERAAAHLVRFLAKTGHPIAALDVYRALEQARADAVAVDDAETLRTLSALVLGLTRERLYDDAAPLATQLERVAGALQVDADTTSATESASLDDGPGESAAAKLELVASAYRTLAKLASDQGRSSTLERLLGRLARLGIKPSTSLEPSARRLRVQLVRQELEEVRAAFASADVSRASDGDRARLWAQLIVAHVRVNDVEGGIRALQDLVGAGLSAPLSAVNSILHGYARRGHAKQAYDLFGQLAGGAFETLKPDATSWNALVLAHAVAHDPSAAAAAVSSMKAAGVAPTRQTWTTLMNAYVEAGMWSAAFTVYRYLETNPDPSLRPDTPVANVMLKACLVTGTSAQKVLDLFTHLVMNGVRPDMATYTLVMQALCASSMMGAAEDLYRFIDSGDHVHGFASRGAIKPDVAIFSSLIAGYARRGDGPKARACLAEMRARGFHPSSVTVAIIVGARLMRYEDDLSGTRLKKAIELATTQARSFLEDATVDSDAPSVVRKQRSEALERRRTRQAVRVDRPLAAGREALAVFGPLLRTLARTGEASDALQLFEEILDRSDELDPDADPPIALYTTLMTAFWQRDQPLGPLQAEAAARNVNLVWTTLYDSVARRFVRLRAVDPAAASSSGHRPRAAGSIRRRRRRLCLPFTSSSRVRFDASNWNALALYFIHDMQLERALWITEHVLCEPTPLKGLARTGDAGSDAPEDIQVADFERELGGLRRADAVGRSPARLWMGRIKARESRRPQTQAQLVEHLQSLTTSPTARDGTLGAKLGSALADAHKKQSAALWHPFGRTLGELEAALDLLSAKGTLRIERKYERRLARADRAPLSPSIVTPAPASSSTSSASTAEGEAEPGTERGEVSTLSPQEAAEARQDLQRRHPKTMRALELWRTRRERLAAERTAHEQRAGRAF
ncbi:uncharacterized protein RHOBADRAFT_51102 [Rhodotorula graminis WP1]|uniref:EF-hand domain-containing protein n=1 Tax=Rhodotorula graminis (strain WP1) TaxID=578459 RepID=A0A194SDV4_RHOGW|nr:uncharacterized protein RHOBADRAFT_51102 [Rhodotorula graminis WP1]KPV78660.1 hypothetical protein RHOBADRAFT_51102 [Rhodotorula graminis WP1]